LRVILGLPEAAVDGQDGRAWHATSLIVDKTLQGGPIMARAPRGPQRGDPAWPWQTDVQTRTPAYNAHA